MKFEIAICDDEKMASNFIMKRVKYLGYNPSEFSFHIYSSGKDLLNAMKGITFALIFLDVQMEGMDGEETAEEIRKIDDQALLIFFTGNAEPTPHSIKVRPFRYIKKNMQLMEIDVELKASFDKMMQRGRIPTVKAKINERIVFLHPNDIIYIEKDRKAVRLHISEEAMYRYGISMEEMYRIKSQAKLIDIYELLKKNGFAYPHDSYIINLNYLTSFRENEFKLAESADTFKVTRSKAAEFNRMRKQYFDDKFIG